MGIFGDRIIRDIESIIYLARDVDSHLGKHEIKRARKEIKRIIELDLDEIRRIKDELGDQHILREFYIVLNDAKQLIDDHYFATGGFYDDKIDYDQKKSVVSSIKKLLSEIIRIEAHEISEIKEDREKIKLIKKTWEQNINSRVVFHGTSSAALSKIKRYGLVPGMRIWDLNELMVLVRLMEKAGLKNPVGPWFKPEKKRIFYTTKKDGAEDYARRSPEFWQQLITPNFGGYKASKNYEEALRTICSKMSGQNNRLEQISKNQLINFVKQNSRLDPKEINLGLNFFDRLWDIFGNAKPVVLHISIKAPVLCKRYDANNFEDFLKSFSSYLHIYEGFPDHKLNYLLIPIARIEEKVNNLFNRSLFGEFGEYNSYVEKRIPAKYILKYET
jgi:hypothetical protein